MDSERKRLAELRREEGQLEDALRPLRGLALLGELDGLDEVRKERIEGRLAAIAAKRREILSAQAQRERAARAREQHDLEEQRARTERENALINRVVSARRQRMYDHGLGGANAGGPPKGIPVVVRLANKVEREIAQAFDRECLEEFGVPASSVRDCEAEAAEFGVEFDFGRGVMISAGGAASPRTASSVPRTEE
jgi:hypothetical protein